MSIDGERDDARRAAARAVLTGDAERRYGRGGPDVLESAALRHDSFIVADGIVLQAFPVHPARPFGELGRVRGAASRSRRRRAAFDRERPSAVGELPVVKMDVNEPAAA